MSGQSFGVLIVLRKQGHNANKKVTWMCRCACGNEVVVCGASLHDGTTTSCGCLHAPYESHSRRFHVFKIEDMSGVSGRGVVADGVQFSNGICVIAWRGKFPSTETFLSMDHLRSVHSHGGRTRFVYDDPPINTNHKTNGRRAAV